MGENEEKATEKEKEWRHVQKGGMEQARSNGNLKTKIAGGSTKMKTEINAISERYIKEAPETQKEKWSTAKDKEIEKDMEEIDGKKREGETSQGSRKRERERERHEERMATENISFDLSKI